MIDLESGYVPAYLRQARISQAKSPGSSTPETRDQPDLHFSLETPDPSDDTVIVGNVNLAKQHVMIRADKRGFNGGNGEMYFREIPPEYRLRRGEADVISVRRALAAALGYSPE